MELARKVDIGRTWCECTVHSFNTYHELAPWIYLTYNITEALWRIGTLDNSHREITRGRVYLRLEPEDSANKKAVEIAHFLRTTVCRRQTSDMPVRSAPVINCFDRKTSESHFIFRIVSPICLELLNISLFHDSNHIRNPRLLSEIQEGRE